MKPNLTKEQKDALKAYGDALREECLHLSVGARQTMLDGLALKTEEAYNELKRLNIW